MVLPPVATTPVMLMRFTPEAGRAVIETVIEALTKGGIIIIDSEGLYDDDGNIVGGGSSVGEESRSAVVLGLTTTQKLLENEAEVIRLAKPSRTSQRHIPFIMEHFSSQARQDFVHIGHATKGMDRRLVPWLERESDDFYDEHGLFTPAERALLLESMIAAIPAPKSLEAGQNRKVASSLVGEAYTKLTNSAVGAACHKMRQRALLKRALSGMGDYEGHTSTLVEVLHQSRYIDVVAPIHIPHLKKRILQGTKSITKAPPLQAIRDYYGEGIAFYFAWMHHMIQWYVVPGVVGMVVNLLRTYCGSTVDTCNLTPFVGLITFCWAVVCNRCWERREAELAYNWGTFSLTDGDRRSLGMRHGFKGKMQRSPITGRMERFYPSSKRRMKYVASTMITLFLLACACVVLVISMNLQGYVSRGEEGHPLYFPFFAQLAEEGGIFDAKSTWRGFLPVILRAIVVVNMNQRYSQIAEKLTEWENHETTLEHQNSVILKRVLFEAFDAYMILFYLAIYERDINLLRLELVGAFNIDTLRRVSMECVFPYIIKYFKKDPACAVSASKKDDDLEKKSTGRYLSSEADLEEYDTFDDYIEMLIQFGYVTLFASAYPLAAFIAIGANSIEIRTDAWKLTYLFRRMIPVRANDIGTWKWSLNTFAWLAASSNLLIFAFTSSQLRQWLPHYYVTDEVSGHSVPKASHEILLVVLIIQNCLVTIVTIGRNAISSTPECISVEVQKWLWLQERLASNTRKRTVKRSSFEVSSLSKYFMTQGSSKILLQGSTRNLSETSM